ncbi:VanZ family protein [Hymenobacter qilianensis]|uniref:VanZ family protein n=1 Tax=Hymenobacter qilianensis TaxID=1385715 RepID=A0A7H0GZP4_9BACT|nr:VanZ family protein [Hymenobacter qilianensis]QNP53760.1 VanZ family protein [Hymenobacter qilianensis]
MSPSAPPASPRRAYVALPGTWAAFILLLTLTPSKDMPVTPRWELLSFDTAAHAFVFAVLAVLSFFSIRRQSRFPGLRAMAVPFVIIGSTLFGGLIEVLQSSMNLGRHGEWSDLLSDGIGALLGGFFAQIASRWIK